MKQFFLGHMYLELQMNDEALEIYDFLQQNGFSKNSYVVAQIAVAYHNRRGNQKIVIKIEQFIITYVLQNIFN
jgi:anaphase-promoting complex subunit 8